MPAVKQTIGMGGPRTCEPPQDTPDDTGRRTAASRSCLVRDYDAES